MDEDTFEGWEEDEGTATPCPGCKKVMSVGDCLKCLRDTHGVDLIAFCAQHHLDMYGGIKLVNYLRSKTPFEALDVSVDDFADDKYLHPVIPDDPLMCIDLCPDEDWEEDALPEDGSVPLATCEGTEEDEFKKILEDKQKQQQQASDTPNTTTTTSTTTSTTTTTTTATSTSKSKSPITGKEEPPKNFTKDDVDDENEQAYFDSYSYSAIHIEMIRDSSRTTSYRNYMLENASLFKDKVVLDVGCGTGILSMFAAQAGAKHVYGVDNAAIIDKARVIVSENGFGDKISLFRGLMEEVNLPENVDIIVSEWMGYLLLYESMFDSVIYARDKWLNKGGIVVPDVATMYVCGVDDTRWKEDVAVWDNVYGLSMGTMKEEVVKQPAVTVVDKEIVLTQPFMMKEFDLNTARISEFEFTSDFTMTCKRTSNFAGFLTYFDCLFDNGGDVPVVLGTGPENIPTHWRQVLFHLPKPAPVNAGDLVEGSISIGRLETNKRHISIALIYKIKRVGGIGKESTNSENNDELCEKEKDVEETVLYFELA
eukprot:m.139234 g.139234  ORF g.139234 m.139234 type:complete len:538 (-) comp13165_c0_seq4:1418-3031(-)